MALVEALGIPWVRVSQTVSDFSGASQSIAGKVDPTYVDDQQVGLTVFAGTPDELTIYTTMYVVDAAEFYQVLLGTPFDKFTGSKGIDMLTDRLSLRPRWYTEANPRVVRTLPVTTRHVASCVVRSLSVADAEEQLP
jgi:hypothetical protein